MAEEKTGKKRVNYASAWQEARALMWGHRGTLAIGLVLVLINRVVGFVLPFDRLLDMTRTVPSASANLTVATTVARWEGELDEKVLRAPNQD